MNKFQKAEVGSHKDAELDYVIISSIEMFIADKRNFTDGKYFPWHFFKFVGSMINRLIVEREGFERKSSHQLCPSTCAAILIRAASPYQESVKAYDKMIDLGLEELIFESLNKTRNPTYESNYSGYTIEFGGFCNPMKIKLEAEGY